MISRVLLVQLLLVGASFYKIEQSCLPCREAVGSTCLVFNGGPFDGEEKEAEF